jgi:hypothetical protein
MGTEFSKNFSEQTKLGEVVSNSYRRQNQRLEAAQTRPISGHQQDAGSRVGEMTEGLGRIALRTGSQEAENRMYETV